MEKQLEHGLAQAGLVMSVQQQQQLLDYVRLLHKWNKAYNLTSVRHPDDMVVKHILDSLVVSPYLEGQQFIDVGTGPGCQGSHWPLPIPINNSPYWIVWANGFALFAKFSTNLASQM